MRATSFSFLHILNYMWLLLVLKCFLKEKVSFISGTDKLLDITLEDGKHHNNYEFLDFFKKCVEQLQTRYLLKRVRLDRGFLDEKNFTYFENEGIEYVVKCKMYSSLKKIIINGNEIYWNIIQVEFSDIYS